MRFLFLFFIVYVGLVHPSAQAQHRLEVVVANVKDTTGMIRVGLFSQEDTFLKKPMTGKVIKAKSGEVIVVFEGVPSGDYAVSIIHDSNQNGKLDSNFFGIPKEGFGFSNNVMGSMGPPSFDKAKFHLQSALTMRIATRYY